MSTNESASDEVEYSAVPGSAVYAAAVVTAEEETLSSVYSPGDRIIFNGVEFEKVESVSRLGQGGFGSIWQVKPVGKPGPIFAMKCPTKLNDSQMEALEWEAELYGKLNTANHYILGAIWCTFLDVAVGNRTWRVPHMLMKCSEYGSLNSLLRSPPNTGLCDFLMTIRGSNREISQLLYMERVLDVMLQIAFALTFAHDHDVIHADLKPDNILVINVIEDDGREFFNVALCDFGLSVGKHDPSRGLFPFGTTGFRPLEQEHHPPVATEKSDVFSFAKVFIYLITKRVESSSPFTNLSSVIDYIVHLLGEKAGNMMNDLLTKCLKVDSDLRPTMSEVVDELSDICNDASDIFDCECSPDEISPLLMRGLLLAQRSANPMNFDDALRSSFEDARRAREETTGHTSTFPTTNNESNTSDYNRELYEHLNTASMILQSCEGLLRNHRIFNNGDTSELENYVTAAEQCILRTFKSDTTDNKTPIQPDETRDAIAMNLICDCVDIRFFVKDARRALGLLELVFSCTEDKHARACYLFVNHLSNMELEAKYHLLNATDPTMTHYSARLEVVALESLCSSVFGEDDAVMIAGGSIPIEPVALAVILLEYGRLLHIREQRLEDAEMVYQRVTSILERVPSFKATRSQQLLLFQMEQLQLAKLSNVL